jgi:hypothetical protein
VLLLWLFAAAEAAGADPFQTLRVATMAILVALLAFWIWSRLARDE